MSVGDKKLINRLSVGKALKMLLIISLEARRKTPDGNLYICQKLNIMLRYISM